MRKILVTVSFLVMMILPARNTRSIDVEQYMGGANYLEEYQARQRRNELISKGVLLLLVVAGGMVLAFKFRKK